MKFSEVVTGILVEVQEGGNLKEAVVVERDNQTVKCKILHDSFVKTFTDKDFNLKLKPIREKTFSSIGKLKQGTQIRLGRNINHLFIPGSITLFVDGFIERGDSTLIIGKNPTRSIRKELNPSDYGKKWVLEDS